MEIELNRKDLEALVKGSQPDYSEFNNPLVKKAGHLYSDQYGKTSWSNLSKLTEEELYELYVVCRDGGLNVSGRSERLSCEHRSFRAGHSPFVACICNDCGEEL